MDLLTSNDLRSFGARRACRGPSPESGQHSTREVTDAPPAAQRRSRRTVPNLGRVHGSCGRSHVQSLPRVDGLFVLDCIAPGAIGADLRTCGVDVLISAPQKGRAAAPCCGLVMLGERALVSALTASPGRRRVWSLHARKDMLKAPRASGRRDRPPVEARRGDRQTIAGRAIRQAWRRTSPGTPAPRPPRRSRPAAPAARGRRAGSRSSRRGAGEVAAPPPAARVTPGRAATGASPSFSRSRGRVRRQIEAELEDDEVDDDVDEHIRDSLPLPRQSGGTQRQQERAPDDERDRY
jgi:hypothetical protein